MNKEVKQKWIEALRSGKYSQGEGVLRDHADRFCCLGVLCDVMNPAGWGEMCLTDTSVNGHDAEIEARPFKADDDVSSISIPHSLRERIGLHVADASTLITMNDRGESFETIAKHIEANVDTE